MPLKSQSAMEYLMTYGWAILIIAIVMVALFSLGIFNSSEPRVSAGACEVYRSTATTPSLTGECQGVWPQFVAQFVSAGLVSIPSSTRLSLTNTVTISFWIYVSSMPGACGQILNKQSSTSDSNYNFYIGGDGCIGGIIPNIKVYANANGGWASVSTGSQTLNLNTWYNVVWSYTSSNGGNLYINDVLQSGSPVGSGTLYSNTDPLSIDLNFQGSVADVQIYNTSLSQEEVTALYQEGIGGAPIDPTHIVGWWPLNGNTQDYSGNGNNGAATAVTYTSAWTSGYTQP